MPGAQYWIDHLTLKPHSEGGFFRESYRSSVVIPELGLPTSFRGPRSASTAIYFLLERPDTNALVGCRVAPGFDFSDFEMARRADLLAQSPQYKDVIHKLSRPQ